MIRFEQVVFRYNTAGDGLNRLDLKVGPGLTLLVGPNGAGKSTLLRLAAGIQKPDSGSIFIDDLNLWVEEESSRRNLTYLPDHADLTPYATVIEVLRLVCRIRRIDREAAVSGLEAVGLGKLGGRSIRELSFGQRRRAMLAAVMIGDPHVLLLDEPLDGMDREMRDLILGWIEERHLAGATILLSSHEIETFHPMAENVLGLRDGRVAAFISRPDRTTLEELARGVHSE
jgi:ABC-2 type transport system ATP-binding protein